MLGHVAHVAEVDRLALRIAADEIEPIVDVVHDDHASGAHQPSRLGGEDAHRPGAEHQHRVALGDLTHLGGLVAGGKGVGEKHRIVERDVVRNLGRADVGQRHAHVLRLATVVAAVMWP